MISLTCDVRQRALDRRADRHGDDLDGGLLLVRPAPFDRAVVDGERSPQMAVGEDGDGQEGLDLLVLEVPAQVALDLAGAAGEHLALADLLGEPCEQRIGIHDGLQDDARPAGDSDRLLVHPIGRDRLGKTFAGQFAQPEQDRPMAAERARQKLEDLVDDALPFRRLVQPSDDARRRDRAARLCDRRIGARRLGFDHAGPSARRRTPQRPSSGSEKM